MKIHKKAKIKIFFYGIILIPFLFLSYISFWSLLPDFRFGPDLRFSSKIIDPDEVGFNPDDFCFNDYNNYADLLYVLTNMFPEGTEEEIILQKLKDSFGQKKAVEIQEVDSKYLSTNTELSTLDHKIFTRYKKMYPLRICIVDSEGSADAIEYLFDRKNKLIGIRIMSGCLRLGKVYGND